MTDTGDDYEGNNAFYKLYADYLVEERVRKVHDAVLYAALQNPALQRVIDLGCGKGNEFFHYGQPDFYVGVDQNADAVNEPDRITQVANYRNFDIIEDLIKDNNLTAAVSLFSVEITKPRDENHAYYEDLFRNTGINAMLIGGFYYEHAKGEETVQEEGGVMSYQTAGTIDCPDTELFHETRVEIPCPSTLFGEDVIEVYRLLQRPGHIDRASIDALSKLAPEGCSVTTRNATNPIIQSSTPKRPGPA